MGTIIFETGPVLSQTDAAGSDENKQCDYRERVHTVNLQPEKRN